MRKPEFSPANRGGGGRGGGGRGRFGGGSGGGRGGGRNLQPLCGIGGTIVKEMLIKDAPLIWNSLKSIVCVYKPSGITTNQVCRTVINAVIEGLNEMDCRPPTDYVSIEGNPLQKLTVTVKPNLADDPLVVGPRYQHDDLRCTWSNFLGYHTSGVLLLGLRDGTKVAKRIRENRPTRCYRVSGRFGEATENGFKDEKVIERSTWKHVKSYNMDRLLSTMQASHQKEMFKSSGIDIQSQAAYELASRGPIRPANSKLPVIYGIKCVKFEPPDFTIELQCVNEYETYLKSLIHEIGIKMNSTAHCTAIQCIRHSYFTVDNTLLRKHWTLQHLISNMEDCIQIINQHENLLRQESAVLQ